MIEIVNRQRKIKIDAEIFRDFADKTVSLIPEAIGKSVVIAFVSDHKMRELNGTFRGKRLTTDVLSFPFDSMSEEVSALADGDFLGDIAISLEQALRQAVENDLDFSTEIKQLILHGILHLCGYDHETDNGEMNSLELKLRDKLLIG